MMRKIKRVQQSRASSDGNGVKIQRVHGFTDQHFSPFLMLDELCSENPDDYIGGFPPHPHRGIETLTYMLKGHIEHKDHLGNRGQLFSGGAQWMSAGKGVIHSEMPMMQDGELHGFQIWLNLPANKKMLTPKYRDFQSYEIKEYGDHKNLLRVIAGSATEKNEKISGPLQQTGVDTFIADWQAKKGAQREITLPSNFNVHLYVYKGEITIGDEAVNSQHFVILSSGEKLCLNAKENSGALILAGEPINESIAHYGPFVMNTEEEIQQAIKDFQAGQLTY